MLIQTTEIILETSLHEIGRVKGETVLSQEEGARVVGEDGCYVTARSWHFTVRRGGLKREGTGG